MKKINIGVAIAISLFFTGCMNMPTNPSQISATYVSPTLFANYSCEQLITELNSLSRRETSLVVAQEQRIKTSEMQAFWWGFGQGDGIEASELAHVRGQKEAVQKSVEAQKCEQPK